VIIHRFTVIATGIKNNVCHVCFNKYPFDFVVSNRNRDGSGTSSNEVAFRDPMAQYDCAQKYAAIKVASDLGKSYNKQEKKRLEEDLMKLNSRIGEILPFIVFEGFIRKGIDLFCLCSCSPYALPS